MWFNKKTIAVALGLLAIIVVGSSADVGGELIGVLGRKGQQKEVPPYGMVLIPQGSFNMGLNDQDAFNSMNAPTTPTSLGAFWIDQTEITNNEYRQFVQYVYDSIARRLLAEQFDEFVISEDAFGNPIEPPVINWRTKINPKSQEQMEILRGMYTASPYSPSGRALDVDKLTYAYSWVDYKQLVRDTLPDGRIVTLPKMYKEVVRVYPDTLTWIRDFDFSYNEPLAFRYYSHPAYDDYPVVGVSWKQATAFCHWRTGMMRDYCLQNKRPIPNEYRLPTEAEWEYAARGGLDQQMYPWGGPYTYDREGCYLANFLPQRARYGIDGGVCTLPVGSYLPNDYGLFDMAGNVAEWTASAFDEQSYAFVNAINPSYTHSAGADDALAMKRKTIKGGSWKDIAYFLQCGARTFEYQDTTKSYIGFRCVRSYLGK